MVSLLNTLGNFAGGTARGIDRARQRESERRRTENERIANAQRAAAAARKANLDMTKQAVNLATSTAISPALKKPAMEAFLRAAGVDPKSDTGKSLSNLMTRLADEDEELRNAAVTALENAGGLAGVAGLVKKGTLSATSIMPFLLGQIEGDRSAARDQRNALERQRQSQAFKEAQAEKEFGRDIALEGVRQQGRQELRSQSDLAAGARQEAGFEFELDKVQRQFENKQELARQSQGFKQELQGNEQEFRRELQASDQDIKMKIAEDDRRFSLDLEDIRTDNKLAIEAYKLTKPDVKAVNSRDAQGNIVTELYDLSTGERVLEVGRGPDKSIVQGDDLLTVDEARKLGVPLGTKLSDLDGVIPPVELSAGERTELANLNAQLGQLDDVKTAFDALGESKPLGFVKGRALMVRAAVGDVTEQEQALIQSTSSVQNIFLKLRSGAAVTQSEFERFMREAPKVTDSDAQFETNLRLTRRNVTRVLNEINDGTRQFGTRLPLPDFLGVTGTPGSTTQQGTDPSEAVRTLQGVR